MEPVKDRLLDINFSLTREICKLHVGNDNIDEYMKMLEREIRKYMNITKGLRKRDLHLYPKDLTDNPPANARRRFKRALERINQHNMMLGGLILKYNEEDKKNMAKALRLYFITVEIEELNIQTKLNRYRERLDILKVVKKELSFK